MRGSGCNNSLALYNQGGQEKAKATINGRQRARKLSLFFTPLPSSTQNLKHKIYVNCLTSKAYQSLKKKEAKKRSFRFNISKIWNVQYAVVLFPIFSEYMSDGPYLELHLCTFVAPVFCFYDIRYAPKVLYISKFTNTRSISSIFPIPMILF